MSSAEQIKRMVRQAFPQLPVPDSIVDPATGDDETTETLRRELQGKQWADIPVEVLGFHHDAPAFLSPSGFCYLLPAFIMAAFALPDRPIADVLVLVLTEPEDSDDKRAFFQLVAPLTDEQRAVVRAYLEYLRDEDGENWPDDAPGRALRLYWAKA